MLSVLSGCATTAGSGDAALDAMRLHMGECARALTGDDIAAAREGCLPLFVIYGTVR